MTIYTTRTDDESQKPPSGYVIEWDHSADVYEAWHTPSATVRTWLGAFADYDDALGVCRIHDNDIFRGKRER